MRFLPRMLMLGKKKAAKVPSTSAAAPVKMAGEAASVNPVGVRVPSRAVKIAVRVATPSAIPTCRMVILVPEAVALSSGTMPCRVAVAIGAKTMPIPTPAANIEMVQSR